MTSHFDSRSFDQDGRSGLRRAAMFRSGAAVGVVLLVVVIASASLSTGPSNRLEPASAPPQVHSPYEQREATRDHEPPQWVQGTQG